MRTVGLTPREIRAANINLMHARLEILESTSVKSMHQGRIVAKSMRHLCSRIEYEDELTEAEDETLKLDAENFKREIQNGNN